MARYRETAVNDGGSGGSKYGQLADNARANNPLAVPTPTYSGPSNPVNTVSIQIGNGNTKKPSTGGSSGVVADKNYSPSSLSGGSSGGSNVQAGEAVAVSAQREAEERAQRQAEERARQEELRRLEEERRMREEQERIAQAERQAAVDTAQAEAEERREQPSSSYMPYGDPRQNTDNPLAPARIGRYAGDYPAYTGEQPDVLALDALCDIGKGGSRPGFLPGHPSRFLGQKQGTVLGHYAQLAPSLRSQNLYTKVCVELVLLGPHLAHNLSAVSLNHKAG